MGIAARLKTIRDVVRDKGLADTVRYAAHRFVENRYERRFGIDTGHEVMLDTLGVHDPDAVRYSPTPYPAFFKAMKLVGAPLEDSTFVDYGSGLGRIVVCAATLPLKHVIGVEFVPELAKRCRKNIAQATPHLRAPIDIEVANAATWPVPAEANILHFYNPFLNETLKGCIGQVAKSLRAHPREIWVVFASPWQYSRLLAAGEIIPKSWQRESWDARWPFHRDISAKDPNGYRYRVYRVQPD